MYAIGKWSVMKYGVLVWMYVVCHYGMPVRAMADDVELRVRAAMLDSVGTALQKEVSIIEGARFVISTAMLSLSEHQKELFIAEYRVLQNMPLPPFWLCESTTAPLNDDRLLFLSSLRARLDALVEHREAYVNLARWAVELVQRQASQADGSTHSVEQ